jgi:hypothetical protein
MTPLTLLAVLIAPAALEATHRPQLADAGRRLMPPIPRTPRAHGYRTSQVRGQR